MDCQKVGQQIRKLRAEKCMTQKQIADALGVRNQAVSKWERGLGCPDVTLLSDLAAILDVNIEHILKAESEWNNPIAGNMKKVKFYACPSCKNVMMGLERIEMSCCGKKMQELVAKKSDEAHEIQAEWIETDYFISLSHEMKKQHYISFIAYVTSNQLFFTKLYPEQNAETRFRKVGHGKLFAYCTEHGLFERNI